MINFQRPLKLDCQVQHYAWGKVGSASLIAKVLNQNADKPYAELWMGAHPNAPSIVRESGQTIQQLIDAAPAEVLGEGVIKRFGKELPFLFKLLSVGTALSIQAHPNRALAAKLNKADPKHYPDDNHKPELAIAVTELELLYGFRDLRSIKSNFERLPELVPLLREPELCERLLKEPAYLTDRELLQDVYSVMLTASDSLTEDVTRALMSKFEKSADLQPEDRWFVKLEADYPRGDVGLFSFYALNLFRISPGSGLFVPAGVPHAYLSGDLIECMANSDNVLRAGLTPKFKDVPALLDMLMFTPAILETITPATDPNGVKHYRVPAEEFIVDSCETNSGASIACRSGVQFVFCLEGRGKIVCASGESTLETGDCYLLPAALGDARIELERGKVFRAGVP